MRNALSVILVAVVFVVASFASAFISAFFFGQRGIWEVLSFKFGWLLQALIIYTPFFIVTSFLRFSKTPRITGTLVSVLAIFFIVDLVIFQNRFGASWTMAMIGYISILVQCFPMIFKNSVTHLSENNWRNGLSEIRSCFHCWVIFIAHTLFKISKTLRFRMPFAASNDIFVTVWLLSCRRKWLF